MTFQVVAKSTNRTSLVIGEISDAEAEVAKLENPLVDGRGVYLISVNNESKSAFGSVLAKFVSEDAAYELASFFRSAGRLEMA